MHILFVDDIFETRRIFRLSFRLKGHTVDIAADGDEALGIIAQSAAAIDVIIMDYMMPRMTGLEAVRRLKQIKSFASIPIILFTGATEDEVDAEAKELGVNRVVYKPCLPSELLDISQELISSNTTGS